MPALPSMCKRGSEDGVPSPVTCSSLTTATAPSSCQCRGNNNAVLIMTYHTFRKRGFHAEQQRPTQALHNNVPYTLKAKSVAAHWADDEARKERQKKEGLCYGCGLPGLIVARCPDKTKVPLTGNPNPYPSNQPEYSGKGSTR